MKTRTTVLALSILAITAGFAGFFLLRFGSGDGTSVLRPNAARLLSKGAVIYAKHCAACHGANQEGQPDWRTRGADGLLPAPPHDASGHTWHHCDETLFRITKFGVASIAGDPDYKTAMPVYEGDSLGVQLGVQSRFDATDGVEDLRRYAVALAGVFPARESACWQHQQNDPSKQATQSHDSPRS